MSNQLSVFVLMQDINKNIKEPYERGELTPDELWEVLYGFAERISAQSWERGLHKGIEIVEEYQKLYPQHLTK